MKTARTFWLFFFFFWTAVLSAQENQEQNWNIFRGSGGLGLHPGSSLPVQWDESIFVTSAIDSLQKGFVVAIDAMDGGILWKKEFELLALSHEGEIRWQSEFEGIHARHGGGSSLVLSEKAVIFTREQEEESPFTGSWVAVDKETGQTLWEIERTASRRNSFSTPLMCKHGMVFRSFTRLRLLPTGNHPNPQIP